MNALFLGDNCLPKEDCPCYYLVGKDWRYEHPGTYAEDDCIK